MNLVILINSAQMFFRSFGVRHVTAAFGDFAIELAGPKAGRMIVALFASSGGGRRNGSPSRWHRFV
jgi:hypothetical protein